MSTIFWSWQSDLDARVTRDLIRGALASAIADLHAELEERHELTSDTQGVAGSPDIVATILEKIDAATVFVGDVTPIAISASGKAVANPNVLIEMGYAKKSLGLHRVILVWNTAFEGAETERLPFDMRGRRAPMAFHLPTGASSADLRTARDQLREQLRSALRASIAIAAPAAVQPLADWQPAHPATPALWFDPGAELTINEGGVPGINTVRPGSHAYVRILPAAWIIPANFAQGDPLRPLGPTLGYSWGTTKGGVISYSGSFRSLDANNPIIYMAMQFRSNGEIWGANSFVTSTNANVFYADAFIKHADAFIQQNVGYLLGQGASGPFKIRVGVTELSGLHWVTETRWGGRPVAVEDAAETMLELAGNTEEERLAALEIGWGEITGAFGLPQPSRLILMKQMSGF